MRYEKEGDPNVALPGRKESSVWEEVHRGAYLEGKRP